MRTVRWLAALAVVTGTTLALPAPAQAKPSATPAERAAALVAPAMVRLEVSWQGYVRNKSTGQLLNDQPITITTSCAGFAVSADGYLATAGQCVEPGAVAPAFYQQVADQSVARGGTREQAAALLTDLLLNGTIVGQPVDAPPKRTVSVRRGVTPDDALPATVVSIAPVTAGDVAVLKIEKNNQPVVRLAPPADVKAGLAVLTVEYPAGSPATAAPTARLGSIAQTDPVLLANAGPSESIPGSPVLTLDGEVVGVLSRHQPSLATDVLGPVGALVTELQAAKASSDLSQLDVSYRDGLDAYYDGRYTDSIEKFDAVLAIVPSHRQAHDFREQAQALREAEGGGRHADSGMLGSVRGWLGGVLGPLAAAAVLAGLALVLVRRRGHRPEPAPISPAPGSRAESGRIRLATPDYCRNCSNALPAGATECPSCGRARDLTGELSEETRKTHR
jgi:serine protease Do